MRRCATGLAVETRSRLRITAALLVLLAGCAVATGVPRSVKITFIGDSITAQLGELETLFGPEARTWVNAGIPGDTAAGVRVRIERDVPPTSDACIILVGINDIWGGAGNGGAVEDLVPPGTLQNGYRSVGGELTTIVQDLRARGITPVLSTVMPVAADYFHAETFNPKVRVLNEWIRQYAATNGIALVDYYAVFIGPDGTGIPTLLQDGIHPNASGQALMVTTARAALRRADIIP